MKKNPFASLPAVPRSRTACTSRLALLCAGLLVSGTFVDRAAELQIIHNQRSSVVTNLTPVRHSSRWSRLNLAIGLPLRDRAGLTNLLHQLYDPASTNFHRFLTPAQFAERFGPTEQDYAAVVTFAETHGLAVTARHSNRTLLSVRGTAADLERAFYVTLNDSRRCQEGGNSLLGQRRLLLRANRLAAPGFQGATVATPGSRSLAGSRPGQRTSPRTHACDPCWSR